MSNIPPSAWALYGAVLTITLFAAVTDTRTGLIPNKLTLPVLVAAIATHTVLSGTSGLMLSVLGMLICGATPFLFHRLGAMGGGDVKLFAALGALAGPGMGLEIQLLSMSSALAWGLCVLAYRGKLFSMIGRAGRVLLGLFWPPARHKAPAEHELTSMRIGLAIFAGSLITVCNRILFGGLVP
jgi:prepilin peptidase CpaA